MQLVFGQAFLHIAKLTATIGKTVPRVKKFDFRVRLVHSVAVWATEISCL